MAKHPPNTSIKTYETKDSGQREEFTTGSVRDLATGKGRYDLISPIALRRLAGVYERGAVKYSLPLTIAQACIIIGAKCSCPVVIHLLCTHGDSVEAAMRSGFVPVTPNSLNVSVKTPAIGGNKTPFEPKNLNESLPVAVGSPDLALLLRTKSNYLPSKEVALYAAKAQVGTGFTWITIIAPAHFGASSVQSATTDLVTSEMIRDSLKLHCSTCAVQRERVSLSGDRNWEKGQPVMRTLDSALRHIYQAIEGYEDEDHLAQGAWNLFAAIHILEMIERGLLPDNLDDRPNYIPLLKGVEDGS